jgi:hypothetical protein
LILTCVVVADGARIPQSATTLVIDPLTTETLPWTRIPAPLIVCPARLSVNVDPVGGASVRPDPVQLKSAVSAAFVVSVAPQVGAGPATAGVGVGKTVAAATIKPEVAASTANVTSARRFDDIMPSVDLATRRSPPVYVNAGATAIESVVSSSSSQQ